MAETATPAPISENDRWTAEFQAAREWQPYQSWLEEAKKIDRRLRDSDAKQGVHETHWNLFPADVHRMEGMLFGRVPQATVGRRFQDADDDLARVASEILQRLLNTDLESQDDDQSEAWKNAMRDWLGVGLGDVKLRYVRGEVQKAPDQPAIIKDGVEAAPAVPGAELRPDERVETDYFHWTDVLWSPARTWAEVRWKGYRVPMTVEQLRQRWPDVADRIPLESKKDKDDEKRRDPVARAAVWEVWDKEHEKQVFFVEGYGVLETNEDPLQLDGFWPCPKPMVANVTTTAWVPVPDWHLSRDLYDEIDRVSGRITALERAIKVRGVYDKSAESVKRLLEEAGENDLIPAENWGAFSEKGGLKGMVDWLPLEMITTALLALRDYRTELVNALYQVRGTSDIMRGQAQQAGATATEQRAKVKFGSIVLQSAQDEFARFVSDSQRIKGEIIAKHFDPATILARCNCERTTDADRAEAAVAMLKSDVSKWRIEVKPEAINFQDFAALKEERTEILGGLTAHLESTFRMAAQFGPQALAFGLEVGKWYVAGMRGSSTLESIMDKYIKRVEQMAQQPQQAQQPDPKVIAQQMKGQQDMAKVQAELQADLTRINAEVAADREREANQMAMNTREHLMKTQISAAHRPPERPAQGGGAPR